MNAPCWSVDERMAKAAAYYDLALQWQLASAAEVRAWAEHVAARTVGELPGLVVDLLDQPNATAEELRPILAGHAEREQADWASRIVFGRLSVALRTADRSVAEAVDVLRVVPYLNYPLAEIAEIHRHHYILATEVEEMDYDQVVHALRHWLASFEEAAIEARVHVPLVWQPLGAPRW